jgi:hypothetical protein
MLILKADRLGTTARIPVCYPVMFQTDWYMDEGQVLDVSLPGCAIESSRCLTLMSTFACKGSSLITRFAWRSPRCVGRRATGAVWNY